MENTRSERYMWNVMNLRNVVGHSFYSNNLPLFYWRLRRGLRKVVTTGNSPLPLVFKTRLSYYVLFPSLTVLYFGNNGQMDINWNRRVDTTYLCEGLSWKSPWLTNENTYDLTGFNLHKSFDKRPPHPPFDVGYGTYCRDGESMFNE